MEIRPIFSALMRNKMAPLLVAAQVAISLALLANALHIVSERTAMSARPSGMVDEASTFMLSARHLKSPPHEENIALQLRQQQLLAAIPGVVGATWTSQMPMTRSGSFSGVTHSREVKPSVSASRYYSSDGFIKTMGLKIVEGRDFKPAEITTVNIETDTMQPPTVIITSVLAKYLFPNEASVVGKQIYWGQGTGAESSTIVGVVERLQSTSAVRGDGAEYSAISPTRISSPRSDFVVRAEPGQRDRVMAEAEEVIRKSHSQPMIIKTETVEKHRRDRYRNDNGLALMLIAVSVLLMLVTVSGIVGMTALWVSQRRKQIGVRRALGATQFDILRYFITENILITLAGVVSGLVMAVGLNQLLVAKFELAKLPISYLVAGSVIFFLLGIVAAYAPARRAACISPALATRSV
jgi:putative ABC transport system permease protein